MPAGHGPRVYVFWLSTINSRDNESMHNQTVQTASNPRYAQAGAGHMLVHAVSTQLESAADRAHGRP